MLCNHCNLSVSALRFGFKFALDEVQHPLCTVVPHQKVVRNAEVATGRTKEPHIWVSWDIFCTATPQLELSTRPIKVTHQGNSPLWPKPTRFPKTVFISVKTRYACVAAVFHYQVQFACLHLSQGHQPASFAHDRLFSRGSRCCVKQKRKNCNLTVEQLSKLLQRDLLDTLPAASKALRLLFFRSNSNTSLSYALPAC